MTNNDSPSDQPRLHLGMLLTRVMAAFLADVHAEIAERGFPDLGFAHGANVFQFLEPESGLRLVDLAQRARVSKQAISQLVGYLERHGYVQLDPDPLDGRAKIVSLTPLGKEAKALAGPIFRDHEARWRERFGAETMTHLRLALSAIVTQLEDSGDDPTGRR